MELEALRGFAAFYVAAGHIVLNVGSPGAWQWPFKFGQEAVMLFFFLSGAVIHLTHTAKRRSYRGFLLRRFQRIYFPLIVAMLVTTAVKALNGHLGDFTVRETLGNLLMLQDVDTKPGGIVDPYLSNLPLWSLSYEWVFYVLYPPLLALLPRGRPRLAIMLATSLLGWGLYVAAPNHFLLVVAYMVIWWAGVELADCWLRSGTVRPRDWALVGLMLSPMAAAALPPVLTHLHDLHFGYYPLLTFRHLAVAAVLPMLGAAWLLIGLRGFRWTFGPFAALAPISYAVYVLHFPIVTDFGHRGTWMLLLAIPAVLVISYVTEVKLQPRFNQGLASLARRVPMLARPATEQR
jgi:peptidoglycan/LPS O-acetylase OafA/YrhL